jgi:hypothetical protein
MIFFKNYGFNLRPAIDLKTGFEVADNPDLTGWKRDCGDRLAIGFYTA